MSWISVFDMTPELDKNVLAVCDGEVKIMALCEMRDDDGLLCDAWCMVYDGLDGDANFDDDYNVTHWMPIPEPPKEEQP
jgi:hypothetical protein